MLLPVRIEYLVELVFSDVVVDSGITVAYDFLLKIPCVGGDANHSFDVDLTSVDCNRILETDLRRLVLVKVDVASAFCEVSCDKISNY